MSFPEYLATGVFTRDAVLLKLTAGKGKFRPTPTTYYRVNYSFMGFPIMKGEHRITVSYWPNYLPLGMMEVSMLLILILPFIIIYQAVKREF